jgi:hypothetical protein
VTVEVGVCATEATRLNLPFFTAQNATAGLERLELSVSGRYDHYQQLGGTFNPKIGLVWSPVKDLSLRGSWSTSFVAPNMGLITSIFGVPQIGLNIAGFGNNVNIYNQGGGNPALTDGRGADGQMAALPQPGGDPAPVPLPALAAPASGFPPKPAPAAAGASSAAACSGPLAPPLAPVRAWQCCPLPTCRTTPSRRIFPKVWLPRFAPNWRAIPACWWPRRRRPTGFAPGPKMRATWPGNWALRTCWMAVCAAPARRCALRPNRPRKTTLRPCFSWSLSSRAIPARAE